MARWDSWEPPVIEKPVAQFAWEAPYAALVHEGAEGGGIIYPARPWTDHAIAQTDFEKVFASAFKATSNLQSAFESMVDAFEWACQEAMSIKAWYWPTQTYRFNGEIVPPGPRDIRDMDELLNSLNIEFKEATDG
jgi:hypothetical protein